MDAPALDTKNPAKLLQQLEIDPPLPQRRDWRIGCVGAGFIMHECQLPAYANAGLRATAICSRSQERAQEVAAAHGIPRTYASYRELVADPELEILDIAVPPDVQIDVVRAAVARPQPWRGILAQKPLGVNYAQAKEIVTLCDEAGIPLAVNQNMRFDQSVRACRTLLQRGELGEPVLATIDMRAIPHWMPWQQRQGWVTLRIMSIHHLDTFRFWLGDPVRAMASVRPDPRTQKRFPHQDGIALYILEFPGGARASAWDDVWSGPAREGAAADLGINWRVEGTSGAARGTIGWPSYPERQPSTLDFTTIATGEQWISPRWDSVWFPDAFLGPMAELLCALEANVSPSISGHDNLKTMALVDACYRSTEENRAVEPAEIENEFA